MTRSIADDAVALRCSRLCLSRKLFCPHVGTSPRSPTTDAQKPQTSSMTKQQTTLRQANASKLTIGESSSNRIYRIRFAKTSPDAASSWQAPHAVNPCAISPAISSEMGYAIAAAATTARTSHICSSRFMCAGVGVDRSSDASVLQARRRQTRPSSPRQTTASRAGSRPPRLRKAAGPSVTSPQ